MYTDFTQMPVWKNAMDIAAEVYHISETLPRKEDYALTSQIRRSAESISANIAEGFGRGSEREKSQFYRIARGSANETKSHLLYGCRVHYFEAQKTEGIIIMLESVIFELNKIIRTLENKRGS